MYLLCAIHVKKDCKDDTDRACRAKLPPIVAQINALAYGATKCLSVIILHICNSSVVSTHVQPRDVGVVRRKPPHYIIIYSVVCNIWGLVANSSTKAVVLHRHCRLCCAIFDMNLLAQTRPQTIIGGPTVWSG